MIWVDLAHATTVFARFEIITIACCAAMALARSTGAVIACDLAAALPLAEVPLVALVADAKITVVRPMPARCGITARAL
jgi:hypothetical protein